MTVLTLLPRNFSYSAVHTDASARIARICADVGVGRYVQVSHLNASHDSESVFYRTKAEAEDKVKEAFPEATVIRPGPMYGHEDKLLNNMAGKCHLVRFSVSRLDTTTL